MALLYPSGEIHDHLPSNSAAYRQPGQLCKPQIHGNGVTPRSPVQGSFRETQDGGSSLEATSTSSVEIILSPCDPGPSLLHIAPVLYELGIKRVDHLRAVARLSEEMRDREVKEQALKRVVTVVE
ncbi:hypothetical protein C8T65DRAFT_738508 [Cerioporus squamosus]|nr:hypothetical protein C8T65DRAFT_738508 [Cerioporus squamosus]